MLNNYDLIKNKYKYSLEELTKNIHNLNKKILLNTQYLSEEFCIEYILDMRINSGDEDNYLLCEDYILECQIHLDEKRFLELRNLKLKQLLLS
jgi:hypothetical protein